MPDHVQTVFPPQVGAADAAGAFHPIVMAAARAVIVRYRIAVLMFPPSV